MVTTSHKKAARSSGTAQGRLLYRLLIAATMVWAVADVLVFAIVLVVGDIQGTVPKSTGPNSNNF